MVDHPVVMADHPVDHLEELVTFSASHSVTRVDTDTATEDISPFPGGSGILPASDITRDTDSVSTDSEEAVDSAVDSAEEAEEAEVMVETVADTVEAAEDTNHLHLLHDPLTPHVSSDYSLNSIIIFLTISSSTSA